MEWWSISIVGMSPVKSFLSLLYPFLILKKKLATIIFRIIDSYNAVQTEADFIEVCYLVDKAAEHTYSKKRINTCSIVKKSLLSPVETEKCKLPMAAKT